MMLKKLLFMATHYRNGEKIFSMIPELCKHFDVYVLTIFNMSINSNLKDQMFFDTKEGYHIMFNKYAKKVWNSPSGLEGDTEYNYREFIIDLINKFDDYDFDIVLCDNDIFPGGLGWSRMVKYFMRSNIPIVASPEGNREYKNKKRIKGFKSVYDYLFLFGEKEKRKIIEYCETSNSLKTGKSSKKFKKRGICGGIPSNDNLKNYHRGDKYILVTPNFIEGQESRFKLSTKKLFEKIKVIDISKEYDCDIVIKLKHRVNFSIQSFIDSFKCYGNVTCINCCEDDNKLMADAKMVIGAPSTYMFKPIQLGVPTVLLKGHGQVGNFYDYPGLVEPNYKEIKKSIDYQMKNGKFKSFVEETISGGLEFNSTRIYIENLIKITDENNIKEIKNEV